MYSIKIKLSKRKLATLLFVLGLFSPPRDDDVFVKLIDMWVFKIFFITKSSSQIPKP